MVSEYLKLLEIFIFIKDSKSRNQLSINKMMQNMFQIELNFIELI
jgi:hypothetical protein